MFLMVLTLAVTEAAVLGLAIGIPVAVLLLLLVVILLICCLCPAACAACWCCGNRRDKEDARVSKECIINLQGLIPWWWCTWVGWT